MSRSRPTAKQVSFAANIIAGMGPREALEASLFDVSNMTHHSKEVFASKLLAHPNIAAAVAKANEETLRGGRLIKDDAMALLESIAEANIGDFLKFGTEWLTDDAGRRRRHVIIETKDSAELTREQLACIQEISEGQNGKVRIKLKSATDALKQLAAMHGWNAAPKAPIGQDGKDVLPQPMLPGDVNVYLAAREQALSDDDC